jgi:putative restriction endonuclease
MMHYLRTAIDADARALEGLWREGHFLSKIPNYTAASLPERARDLERHILTERQRLGTIRLVRDARFSPRVKEQYDYSCAVCQVQLEIVEAAHIVPAHDPRGTDELWNGLALCPSHHTLFDAKRFVVGPNLRIRVDNQAVAFLLESGRASGIELLTNHDNTNIRHPNFWTKDPEFRELMQRALAYTSAFAALG